MQETQQKKSTSKPYYGSATFLTTSFAIYGMMRKGDYRMALELYKRGGGGLNLYQGCKRIAGLDYHPFWDKRSNKLVTRLHYHRGEDLNKHRPYDGW